MLVFISILYIYMSQDNRVYTHIISLKRAKERRLRCLALHENNPFIHIFDAVDFQKVDQFAELQQKYKVLSGNGHGACALSHIIILHQFLEGNRKYVAIMEDDCVVQQRPPTNVREVETLIHRIGIRNPNLVDVLYLSDRVSHNNKHQINGGCGTEGYIFSRQGARKALTVLENLNKPIDLVLQAHYPHCEYLRGMSNSEYPTLRLQAYKTRKTFVQCNDYNVSYINT